MMTYCPYCNSKHASISKMHRRHEYGDQLYSHFTRLIAGLWNDQSKNRGSYYLISSSAYIFS